MLTKHHGSREICHSFIEAQSVNKQQRTVHRQEAFNIKLQNHRILKCDVTKMKFLKLWDLSGYSEKTMSKRPTCQK